MIHKLCTKKNVCPLVNPKLEASRHKPVVLPLLSLYAASEATNRIHEMLLNASCTIVVCLEVADHLETHTKADSNPRVSIVLVAGVERKLVGDSTM